MDIEAKLKSIMNLKKGNKEISLHYGGGEWMLSVGNPCSQVYLGETEGEYVVEDESLEKTILRMEEILKE